MNRPFSLAGFPSRVAGVLFNFGRNLAGASPRLHGGRRFAVPVPVRAAVPCVAGGR